MQGHARREIRSQRWVSRHGGSALILNGGRIARWYRKRSGLLGLHAQD
jgi:hypothetical protein